MVKAPIRLCFIIRSLDCGGSQRQLAELVRNLDPARFQMTVLTFYPGGLFWNPVLDTRGVRLACLGKGGRWDVAGLLARLIALLRGLRPHVVHGYGVVSNEIAWLGARATGARAVWGLRNSRVDYRHFDWTYRASHRVSARLSRCVDLVIANSHAGMRHFLQDGFARHNLAVVPNGIDTDRFRPRPDARRQVRQEWGIQDSELLIGAVGRLDPEKDHATFLEATRRLAGRLPAVRVVCIGGSPRPARRDLAETPAARSLGPRLRWEAARGDIERVLPALDALVLSSRSEGFPNVVAEGMAAEVPCIVTDVGDAAKVLDDPQRTVPPGSPRRLALACEGLLRRPVDERRRIAKAGRLRIVRHYSVARLARRTGALLEAVAVHGSAGPDLAGHVEPGPES